VRVQDVPGRVGELMADSALAPDGDCTVGKHTFAGYLDTLGS
jgi:hypothetical protein